MASAVPRVLLVDDDPMLLLVLCDMLSYHLRPAIVVGHASPNDVAARIQDEQYDVVVCDLKMPRQNGLEVIRQIKAVNPKQVVILMTGSIEEAIDLQAHVCGANAVLRKPFDRDEVLRVIRSFLEVSIIAPPT